MMITQMGFSKKLGQVAWSTGGGPSFLGQSMGQPSDCSGQTSDEIDNEVKELVNRAYRCRVFAHLSAKTCPRSFFGGVLIEISYGAALRRLGLDQQKGTLGGLRRPQ